MTSTIQPEQNMKKKVISFIAFSLFVCAAACILSFTALVLTNADAQHVGPALTPEVLDTGIKGTIKVPAPATSGPFVDFGCANLIVQADSKARTGPLGSKPVWTLSHKATGTYSLGTCSYKLPVPASPHEFTMTVNVHFTPKAPQHCDVESANATGLGGLWTVPHNTWKTNNFSVTELVCGATPH
jgi:hypothetical protein